MPSIIRLFEPKDYDALLQFYKKIDSQFIPPLSSREGGLERHVQTILGNNGTFCIYEVDETIEGAVGFFPVDRETVKCTLFSFTEVYQNSFAPYRVLQYLLQQREELGYSATERIMARTFQSSSAEKLKRLGFRQIAEVHNDIVPERTSRYFEGDLGQLAKIISTRRKITTE